MRLTLRNKYLSQPRYNRYLIATGNDNQRAKKLYLANIRLAQAFYPILSQFEIILRNVLNNGLTSHFTNPDWIIAEKTGFMNDTSLRPQLYLKKQVLKSETKLSRLNITLTSGKIIADQTLGFWIALFSRPHYRLLAGKPIQAFPHKPPHENRATIHRNMKKIREFRNRAHHYEPLCFRGNTIDCNDAVSVKIIIMNLLNWIDPQILSFINKLDNIDSKIDYINRI